MHWAGKGERDVRKGTEGMRTQKKRHWVAPIAICIYLLCSYMSSFISTFSLDKKGRGTEGPWEKVGAESGVTNAGTGQEGGT